jgi:DNA repair protein RadC
MDLPPARIATARDAFDRVQPELGISSLERLVVLHLDRDRQLLDTTFIDGCSLEVELPLRTILRSALSCNAVGLVLAHNHPSGDATPSAADVQATRRLADAAALLGIHVHDHLVIGGDRCSSFRLLGLM